MLRRLVLLILLAVGGVALLGTGGAKEGRVLRIVDGDTLHVRVDGKDETVRIVGIDTPEVGDCGADAATRALERLAHGRVKLIRDRTQAKRDRYGRLLAYVERDGVDLGRRLVRDGWALLFVFDDDPFKRVGAYRRAYAQAHAEQAGAHGRCHFPAQQ